MKKLVIFGWGLLGSMLSPIWGSIYINYVLGTITNRHVIGESGSVYRINKNGEPEKISIDTPFEEIVSGSGSAPLLMLVGGIPYTFVPFIATFYMPMQLIQKGFDRKN